MGRLLHAARYNTVQQRVPNTVVPSGVVSGHAVAICIASRHAGLVIRSASGGSARPRSSAAELTRRGWHEFRSGAGASNADPRPIQFTGSQFNVAGFAGGEKSSLLDYLMLVPSAVCGLLSVWQLDRMRTKVSASAFLQHASRSLYV